MASPTRKSRSLGSSTHGRASFRRSPTTCTQTRRPSRSARPLRQWARGSKGMSVRCPRSRRTSCPVSFSVHESIERNPQDLKRKDQKAQGYLWFGVYDADYIFEENLRQALASLPDSSFPEVCYQCMTLAGDGLHSCEGLLAVVQSRGYRSCTYPCAKGGCRGFR